MLNFIIQFVLLFPITRGYQLVYMILLLEELVVPNFLAEMLPILFVAMLIPEYV
jgi:hypothetical protein